MARVSIRIEGDSKAGEPLSADAQAAIEHAAGRIARALGARAGRQGGAPALLRGVTLRVEL